MVGWPARTVSHPTADETRMSDNIRSDHGNAAGMPEATAAPLPEMRQEDLDAGAYSTNGRQR